MGRDKKQFREVSMSNQKNYEKVTERLMEIIENSEVLPWRQPWFASMERPYNFKSKKSYRGFNILNLSVLAGVNGYTHNAWLTFKQAKSMGYSIKKGEKSSYVVYYNRVAKKEITEKDGVEEEETKYFSILKCFPVFNIEQTTAEIEAIEKVGKDLVIDTECEKVINSYKEREKIAIEIKPCDSAFYSPSQDYIQVPELAQYKKVEEFYSTLFHEIAHSTGHEKRLNRDMSGRFGSDNYSKEELVAEITATILCQENGFTNTYENSSAYLKSWLNKVDNGAREFVVACNKAYRAVDFVLTGKTPDYTNK
jgi:antirestriction protein ArdC